MGMQELSKHFSEKHFERLQAALASMTPERRDNVMRSFLERAANGPKPWRGGARFRASTA